LRLDERQEFDAAIARLDIDRDARQQRDAVAVGHHLHDRCKAGCPKAYRPVAPRGGAIGQRLIAQTMTFFQQYEALLIEIHGGDARARRPLLIGWNRKQELVDK
jgi:hypothetical protein